LIQYPNGTTSKSSLLTTTTIPQRLIFEKFPGLNESRTTVIFTKEGKGAGYARNVGLEHAKGEWLLFVDADDFYNYCFRAFLDDHADVVYFKHNSLNTETYSNTERRVEHLNNFIDLFLYNRNETLVRYANHCPWNMMIRKALVDIYRIHFDETPINNDVTFYYLVGLHASKVNTDKWAVYCWTLRENSLCGNGYNSPEKKLAGIYVHGKILMSWRKQNLHIRFHYTKVVCSLLIHCYFKDKPVYTQAREILLDLGYTPSEIRRFLVKGILNAVTNRFVRRPLKALVPTALSGCASAITLYPPP